MSAVPILGVLALAGAIVAWVTWHRTVDERHSVEHHQHALETLRHVADRAERPARPRPAASAQRRPHPSVAAPRRRAPRQVEDGLARGARGSGPEGTRGSGPAGNSPGGDGATRAQRSPSRAAAVPAVARVSKRAPSPRHPTMVFVDDSSNSSVPADGPVVADGGVRRLRTAVAGVRPMRRRTTVVAAGVSVAVVVSIVLGVTLSSGAPPPVSHRTHPHASHVGARGSGASTTSRRGQGASSPASSSAPAATAPHGPVSLVASSAQPHGAAYSAPASPYTVAIDASGLCWVLAEEVPSGQVLWTGTLQAGDSRSFSGSGTVQMRLGAASDVTVSVDGSPLALPAGFQSPFDVTVSS